MPESLPYVMFTTEGVLEGLLGPFDDMPAAQRAADAMLAAEQAAMDGLDTEHADVHIPHFWTEVKVLDLSHDELAGLENAGYPEPILSPSGTAARERGKNGPTWDAGEDMREWLRIVDAPERFGSLREYAYVLTQNLIEAGWTYTPEPAEDEKPADE